MCIGAMDTVRSEFIAPGIEIPRQSAARGEFPFGFRRQPAAGPLRVGLSVLVSDMYDWISIAAAEIACRSVRMFPVCARNVLPPLQRIAEIHPMIGRREDRGPGHKRFGRSARKLCRIERTLGD